MPLMVQRPSSDLIQNLRATLQKLAESFDAADNQPVMAKLKSLLLLRIADLECAEASQEKKNTEAADLAIENEQGRE
jgi:hypothetical protein